jgi:hypothetical protein
MCRVLLFNTLTIILLMWRIWWAPNSIPICIQQGVTLHILFISENCSTCFGWYFHPSSGVHTTASTASGICHTVTAICRYRGRVGTGLSVLWVAYFSLWGYFKSKVYEKKPRTTVDLKQNIGGRTGSSFSQHVATSEAELPETLAGMCWQQGTPRHRHYIQEVNFVTKMLWVKDNFSNKFA